MEHRPMSPEAQAAYPILLDMFNEDLTTEELLTQVSERAGVDVESVKEAFFNMRPDNS